MPNIPGMPVTTPINLPGMPPITGMFIKNKKWGL